MDVRIVGIDCATQDARVGLALGRLTTAGAEVDVVLCPGERGVVDAVVDWIRQISGPCLIAMDAPLGWPSGMGCLGAHRAGETISAAPNELFRRATDRFIHRQLGKMPLEVGADRIARTALAALRMLGDLRAKLSAPIPLAWSIESVSGPTAIEVYPAATLLAHSFCIDGYKKVDQVEARRALIGRLRGLMTLPASLDICERSADALDAVACVLAGVDFATGRAMQPEDRGLAEREGWIWAASPRPE